MFILINVHPTVGVQFLATIGKASSTQWRVSEGSYSWSVMSSIVGPSLDSVLPRTILPMDVVTVSRYMDPVESSRTILLALILEILDVILSTADTSVGVLPSDRAGSGIFILVAMSMKPWVGVEGCPTASVLVGINAGTVGAPGKWVDGWVEKNWEALPCGLGTPSCRGTPMATGVFSRPSVGGPSTWLNIVTGGGQWLSTGLSISGPSNMSRLVMVTNSPTARHSSLTLSAIFSFGCAFQGNFPTRWCHSLILRTAVRNSHLFKWVFSTFPTYCGKFLCLSHYLYIRQSVIDHLANSDITLKCSIKTKTQTRFMVLFVIDHLANSDITLKCWIKTKTQTRFMVLFTSGSLSAWGESCRMSPPGICLLSIYE